MEFEYNHAKSIANRKKHGITLEEATGLWLAPSVQVQARTIDEERWMMIGRLGGKFYSCVFTVRGNTARLISARRSRKSEEAIYNEIRKNG
ncbi:MAG: BrnT family toxin [Candidatus Omnitrophica bacterium]|nr:BrnT family toxin [Candidatus Omnitrophota bacterium]